MDGSRRTVDVGTARLDTAIWGAGAPSVVFVHDGLGSIRQWGEVPARVAADGGGVLAYDRAGHGASMPVTNGPYAADWMTTEADVLAMVIEEVADGPVRLVGHSDGGSISLLCAVRHPHLVRDLVVLAAHSWVERRCVDAIAALRLDQARLVAALGRYHAHPAELFDAWSGGWTSAEFATWDIRPQLADIAVPVVVAQGDADEYATDEMLWSTADAIGDNATARLLAGCRHAIHRDHPDVVVELAAA